MKAYGYVCGRKGATQTHLVDLLQDLVPALERVKHLELLRLPLDL